MNRIAKFEKISFEQFKKDWDNTLDNRDIKEIYDKIKLPVRATQGSAGYDFFLPCDLNLDTQKSIKIPTGIRVKIDNSYCLQVYPRSSLGFKFSLRLNNTVGIIDSDYYNSSNEGHIFVKLTNENYEDKKVSLKEGEAFVQGIFMAFGICIDDEVDAKRDGGFGSTNRKEEK
ncbi:MAG: deoxyuridine 5'-triphosphate nucleotidohydrolase [Anaerorhabdus sp.]